MTTATVEKVFCGAREIEADLCGRTVGETRGLFRDALGIPSRSSAIITRPTESTTGASTPNAGTPVGEDYVVRQGEQVEFAQEVGRLG